MKGSMFDVLWIILTIFVLGIVLILNDTVLTSVDNAVKASPNMTVKVSSDSSQTIDIPIVNTTIIEKGQSALLQYDTLMPFILIGLLAIAVVSAFFIPTHPVLFIPALFSLLLFVIISGQLTNAYAIIAQQPALTPSANKLVVTANIVSNFPLIATILGAIIMIAMFVSYKKQNAVGSGGQ